MKRILAFSAVALLLSAAPSLAQPWGFGPGYGDGYNMMGFGYGQGYGRGMMPMQPGRGRFTIVDANEDGVISAEEAASAADEVFTAMDADDDGTLTKDEYLAVRMGPQYGFNPERQAARQQAKEDRFSTMDDDSDGSVTKEEFVAAAKAFYDAADTDGDGKVTPWEHRRRNWN